MVDGAWDSLLNRIRDWMILRYALNTDRDLWVWIFVLGAAAHLEYLAVAVLWVADEKPTAFNEYQPKRTLGQAAHLIRFVRVIHRAANTADDTYSLTPRD